MGWLDFMTGSKPALTSVCAAPLVQDVPPAPAFTVEMITAAGASAANIGEYLGYLNAAAVRFDINTPPRRAMFLAQVAHESANFRYRAEIWGPTPAQARYDTRTDLGNTPEADGDGFKFRGHGLIEITGGANHRACAAYFGISVDNCVLWLQTPEGACLSAGWFWLTHGCNDIADTGNFDAVTMRVNGGMNGAQLRRDLLAAITKKM